MLRLRVVQVLSIITLALVLVATPETARAEDAPYCYAGGPGSTQCSVGTTCSVTCIAGYACCNSGNGCHCIIP